jgi:hypothetical protein
MTYLEQAAPQGDIVGERDAVEGAGGELEALEIGGQQAPSPEGYAGEDGRREGQ